MKTSLKLLALLLAAGLPSAAFAEIFGARLPATFTAANLIALFAMASIALLLATDYSPRTRLRAFSAATHASAAPAARRSANEAHRLAA